MDATVHVTLVRMEQQVEELAARDARIQAAVSQHREALAARNAAEAERRDAGAAVERAQHEVRTLTDSEVQRIVDAGRDYDTAKAEHERTKAALYDVVMQEFP
jgi:phage FluMu protein gp41